MEDATMFKTFLLLFALTGIFIIIGKLIAGKKGMIIAFALALVLNFISYWFSDSIILSAYQARPAPAGHRLERLTKQLSNDSGLPMPKVYILPSRSPNAFATGRNPEHAAVAATEGIMELLNDNELKGVMAHELGHVKNRDTLTATVAASISGGVMILSRMALFFGGGDSKGMAKRLAVSLVAPIAATIITLAISRDREYAADEYSATLTGRPRDLASALLKLERGVAQTPIADHSPETAHLFIVHPFSGADMGEVFSTHPPIRKRVERLIGMEGKTR
jgi:heat shock protein HtpX